MCVHHSSKKKLNHPFVYVVMMALGIYAGFSDIAILNSLASIITQTFIQIFKCVSLPVIALSLIVTLSNYDPGDSMRSVWKKTMLYTVVTTLAAAFISFLLYLLLHPTPMLTSPAAHVAPKAITAGDYWQHIAQIVPDTLISPFLEHQVMSVLLVAMVIGTAIRFIPDRNARDTVKQFFRGTHSMFLVIIRWVIAIIPIGLFGFIATTVVQLRSGGSFQGLGTYLMVIVLANIVQGLVVLPLWLKYKGIKPLVAMRAMLPALSLAFFSKSSVGSLPVTMETIEKKLGVQPKISRFVLPLCTSINMNGCSAFIFVTVMYLMQSNGIDVSTMTMLSWVVIASVAALGNAGVPMGCFFLSTSLLASMNVPITLMGIILPFYALIDMLETALNVWSDICVTKVVDNELALKGVNEEEQEPSAVLTD